MSLEDTPSNLWRPTMDTGVHDDTLEVSVKKIWVSGKHSKEKASRESAVSDTPDVLRLQNDVVMFHGVRALALNKDRWEFPNIGTPRDIEVFTLIKFPFPFVGVPAVTLSFGLPGLNFAISAQDICCESFAISLRPNTKLVTTVSLAWKAVGFATFGNFSYSDGE